MKTVNVELPSALLKAANLEEANISQEAARLLALELVQGAPIREPRATFMDFVAKHGVPPLRYSFEELEEEHRPTDRLGA